MKLDKLAQKAKKFTGTEQHQERISDIYSAVISALAVIMEKSETELLFNKQLCCEAVDAVCDFCIKKQIPVHFPCIVYNTKTKKEIYTNWYKGYTGKEVVK